MTGPQRSVRADNPVPDFTALQKIGLSRQSDAINRVVESERATGKYTDDEIKAAYRTVVNSSDSEAITMPDDRLMEAFMTQREHAEHDAQRKNLFGACELIARDRNSDYLRAMLASVEEDSRPKMDLDRAKSILEAPPDAEDSLLIVLFEIRVH